MNYTYLFYDGETGARVGEDSLLISNLETNKKVIVQGFIKAHIICEDSEISEDEVLWTGRITADFEDSMYKFFFVKPPENKDAVITIRAEQA